MKNNFITAAIFFLMLFSGSSKAITVSIEGVCYLDEAQFSTYWQSTFPKNTSSGGYDYLLTFISDYWTPGEGYYYNYNQLLVGSEPPQNTAQLGWFWAIYNCDPVTYVPPEPEPEPEPASYVQPVSVLTNEASVADMIFVVGLLVLWSLGFSIGIKT